MQLIRAACCAYWCLLSLLLLYPDPKSLLRIEGGSGGLGVHFVAFTGLAFITLAGRFPVRRGLLAAVLIGYALSTEALQGLVPNRIVDPIDAVENVLGLVAGALIWRTVWKKIHDPRTATR